MGILERFLDCILPIGDEQPDCEESARPRKKAYIDPVLSRSFVGGIDHATYDERLIHEMMSGKRENYGKYQKRLKSPDSCPYILIGENDPDDTEVKGREVLEQLKSAMQELTSGKVNAPAFCFGSLETSNHQLGWWS